MTLVKWNPFKSNVTRWDPFRDFEDMAERMNRILARNGGEGEEALVTADWAPIVDIQESDKEYVIKAELPEVKKEDVKLTLVDGVLSLEGERRQEKEEKNKKFHRVERSYGRFVRSFTMPADADEKSVRADFKDGMLNVHIAKSEMAKPKSVEIKVA